MIRSLVLGGGLAIGVGCDGTGGSVPLARYHHPEVVERMAPGCLEAGHDTVVCGCTLHDMANAMKSHGYLASPSGRAVIGPGAACVWPGTTIQRWCNRCGEQEGTS